MESSVLRVTPNGTFLSSSRQAVQGGGWPAAAQWTVPGAAPAAGLRAGRFPGVSLAGGRGVASRAAVR